MEIKRNLRDPRQVTFTEDTIQKTEIKIKLTDEEIEQAYRERRLYYNMEDIRSRLEQNIDEDDPDNKEVWIGSYLKTTAGKIRELLADEEWIRKCAEKFDDALSNNDGFMESFWMTADQAIEDMIEAEEEDDG